MTETPQQRSERQFKNYQWRHGAKAYGTELVSWTPMPFRDEVIWDQTTDRRSQFEWYAEAKYSR